MKIFLSLTVLTTTALLIWGSPFTAVKPSIAQRWQSPEAILPMTFAHIDHAGESCLGCHHNYVDATGQDLCMSCHVAVPELWPKLETQFHTLCRGCHVERQLAGKDSGPTRVCIDCHLSDKLP